MCYSLYEDDAEGFVQSFTIQDKADLLAFFEKFGFVVVRDILRPSEVEASVAEVWAEFTQDDKRVKREDPATWNHISRSVARYVCPHGDIVCCVSL